MKTLKEQIAVMQAEDEGEQIEILPLDGSYPCEDKIYQAYDWNRNDYRVKPKHMEVWIAVNPTGGIYLEKVSFDVSDVTDIKKTKIFKFIQAPDDEQ